MNTTNLATAISLIRSDNYVLVNKDLIHAIGLEETVILSELCSSYAYYQKSGLLQNDGSFYCTVDTLEAITSIKEKRQRKALGKLEELSILKVYQKKSDRDNMTKRHILISDNLLEIIVALIKQGADAKAILEAKLADRAIKKAEASENYRANIPFRQNGGTESAKTKEPIPSKRRTINNNRINNNIDIKYPSQDSVVENDTTSSEKDPVSPVIEENTLLISDSNSSKDTQSPLNAEKDSKVSNKVKVDYTNPDFNTFWETFPKKLDKAKAYKAYLLAIVSSGYTAEQINTACANYAKECAVQQKLDKYIKYPTTFLENDYFPKYINVTQAPTAPVSSTTSTASTRPAGMSFDEWVCKYATNTKKNNSLGWDNFKC